MRQKKERKKFHEKSKHQDQVTKKVYEKNQQVAISIEKNKQQTFFC